MSLIEARRNRKWIGCIDFGTAMSKAAVVRRKPRTELTSADVVPLTIGDRDGMGVRSGLLLPSVVYVSDQGTILFGREAEDAAIRGERRNRQAFVSPKEYLSTRDPGALDEVLEREIDPTGDFTGRKLLALFLAHLLVQAGRAASIANVPWPVPLRIARPAWDEERAVAGEQVLRSLILQAFAIADRLGGQLSAAGGITHDAARSALAAVMSDRTPGERCRQARRGNPQLAQIATSRGGAGAHSEVGTKAQGRSPQLLPAADEDQMGQLQPPGKAHPPQHRAGEEAQRPSRICNRP
jgi:hypothetical protein